MSDQHPDLLGLLRGELTNAEVLVAGSHLHECDTCGPELREVAVGHALLTRTTRSLSPTGDRVTGLAEPELPPAPVATRERRWLRPVAAVAAAAALVLGSSAVTSYLQRPDDGASVAQPNVEQQTADLEPVQGTGGGRVVMVSHDNEVAMTVETQDLPTITKGEFYYVWLFNPKTQKMLPLGVVSPGGRANFDLSDSLVKRYQVVDVSLEKDDGDPAHSVTSVLQGSYSDSVIT